MSEPKRYMIQTDRDNEYALWTEGDHIIILCNSDGTPKDWVRLNDIPENFNEVKRYVKESDWCEVTYMEAWLSID